MQKKKEGFTCGKSMALFCLSFNFLLSRKPALRSRKMSEIWSNALEAVESLRSGSKNPLHQGRRGNDHISVALVLALTVTHYVIRQEPLGAPRGQAEVLPQQLAVLLREGR